MPDPERPAPHLLILGGEDVAAALAAAVAERFGDRLAVTYSLAGRTTPARLPPGRVRSGGCGGAEGLAAFLRAEAVTAVIVATHPFAAAISRNARLACDAAGVPRLCLRRPEWQPQPGDRWLMADTAAEAAAALPGLATRVLLTLGTADLAPFAALPGIAFVVRMIAAPPQPPLPGCTVVTGRGPFDAEAETDLLRRHRIDAVVTKASGGGATDAKLVAARALGLPVVMIRRPPPEPGPAVEDVGAVLEWLDRIGARSDNPPAQES
ncbi:cobalt-precorrin-6A reductase [Caenispirillum bisanense]|uniref:cobalt-precorrin-6A reductase n=1 Tax=Caenispirillum bisanense TaxID=414052 RepID=UPI0031CE5C22